jgi:hypothetical protein
MRWNALGWQCWIGSLWVAAGLFTVMQLSHGEASSSITQVYECRVSGQRVFSDQPCAIDADKRVVPTPNNMNMREAAIDYRPSTTLPTKRKAATDEPNPHAKRKARCEALRNDKSKLTSRLRAGYTVKEGERLRERLRKVDSQYYDLRCSGLP